VRIRQVFLRTFRQCHRTGNHPTSSCPHNSRHGSPLRNCPREYHRRHGQNLRGPHRPVPATSAIVRLEYPAGVSGGLQAWLVELVKVYSRPATGHDGRQLPTLSGPTTLSKTDAQRLNSSAGAAFRAGPVP